MANRTAPPAQIREWAREKGVEVGQRGRVSTTVQTAFYAEHTPSGKPKG